MTGDTGATGGTTDSSYWSHERQDEMTDTTGATKDRYWLEPPPPQERRQIQYHDLSFVAPV